MAKKLKDYYDVEYLEELSNKISSVMIEFDKERFFELTKPFIDDLEFNQRQNLIAQALNEILKLDYNLILQKFMKLLGPEIKGISGAFSQGWRLWPIGKYVELYGDNYFTSSINFGKELTKRFTSEYCMRPLISKYPEKSLVILKIWSKDDNERVRRLSSECMRIRLPWAKKLYTALDYFDDYYIILINLKDDQDKYIQKSIANNLNDLYKEDPKKFLHIIDCWSKEPISEACNWVIKHGSRNINK